MGGLLSTPSSPTSEMTDALRKLITPDTILVLSKSYCSYCSSTKRLLASLNLQNVNVLELDERGDGRQLQDAAYELTNQSTVPNIWIGTRHVGGNSDLQALYKSGELGKIIKAEGIN
ncbi:glutaredoxin [Batrachochytrium salamandrivorans]|nr:glutaredoxin [Batrachochytrium salamandrivorans]